MFKHIIWDFDGTLFDTYPTMTDAFKAALEEEGIIESKDKIMSLLKISVSAAVEYYMKEFNTGRDIKDKYDRNRKVLEKALVKPFENVEAVCRTIYKSGRFNYLYTHRGLSSTEFLKAYDMYAYFRDFVTKESNFKRKPDPEALLYLLDKYNIDAEEALMVGDRDIDLLAAKNAGIKACFFNIDQKSDSRYADFYINDMIDLYDIIA